MKESRKRGIVLMNLGSPDSTDVNDVKKYLMEFLMDGRVIDYPWLFRKILVGGIIVPKRAANSAKAYQSVWTDKGSPLIVITEELKNALQEELSEPVEIAMRYGNPSPDAAFKNLMQKLPGIEEVIAIPMYPHYAMSSYETAVEYAKQVHKKGNYPFTLTFIKPFYDNDAYIEALKGNIKPYLQQEYDHILFSFHGIPQRHITKGDITGQHCLKVQNCCEVASPAHSQCYRHQCLRTMRLVTEQLGIPKERYSFSFQSRLGREEWLKPYTDFRLKDMPREGIKKLLILCPAFVSDCLETLEEIAVEGKHTFIEAGGEAFTMIPCLNIHPLWVKALKKWVNEYSYGDSAMVLT
jgi:protoporphyrin/coproporphyrin ferrochelatase